jgi:hypothetical protein
MKLFTFETDDGTTLFQVENDQDEAVLLWWHLAQHLERDWLSPHFDKLSAEEQHYLNLSDESIAACNIPSLRQQWESHRGIARRRQQDLDYCAELRTRLAKVLGEMIDLEASLPLLRQLKSEVAPVREKFGYGSVSLAETPLLNPRLFYFGERMPNGVYTLLRTDGREEEVQVRLERVEGSDDFQRWCYPQDGGERKLVAQLSPGIQWRFERNLPPPPEPAANALP